MSNKKMKHFPCLDNFLINVLNGEKFYCLKQEILISLFSHFRIGACRVKVFLVTTAYCVLNKNEFENQNLFFFFTN